MSQLLAAGVVRKMKTALAATVAYRLPLGDTEVPMNALLGAQLELRYAGTIRCRYCDRKIGKSFNQGYCYPCFSRLARCDSCIVSPEKCHHHQGSCREPEWGEAHCMIEHVVYLANTSGLKVGITRAGQLPTRWIDQGAVQALPIFRVQTRRQSGLVEVAFKAHVADKTNWRAMLQGQIAPFDMVRERQRLFAACAAAISGLQDQFGLQAIQPLTDQPPVTIDYPVQAWPLKVASHNLDKSPTLRGRLDGIKGQYLIFDSAVINMRKYTGYQLSLARL